MAHDAPGLVVHPGATIGDGVTFGAHVVVHAGARIGDGALVQDHAIIGKQPSLAPTSTAAGKEVGDAVIGPGARVCAGAIVFAGARVGEGSIVGDQAYVRERTTIGAATVIGRGSAVDNDVTIGARVRLQSMVYVTAFSVIEDDVFVGPCAMTTNDDTMMRHDRSYPLRGATLRRACRIGGGAVLLPGIEVGDEAFVAAGAVATNDVAPRALVMGVPGRRVRDVGDEELLERWR
jgi:UDP-2-acetamido-3-amino-2,3-dideoxy-glucuronate N-acetyltransferase